MYGMKQQLADLMKTIGKKNYLGSSKKTKKNSDSKKQYMTPKMKRKK
tara:strand:- start:1286 stop:1426 length:141 start_codon:yes stop_codon:yes gene_type:complete